ncbi:MAG: ABC transporter ATP-binding protein [bacterium]
MIRLSRFLKPYIWMLILLVVFVYLQVMANLQLPDYMAHIVNNGILAGDMTTLYQSGAMMLLFTLAGGTCAVIVGFLASRIATGAARDIRKKLFTKVESFSIHEFNTFSTSSLLTRSTNDIQQLQMTTALLFRMALMAPMSAIGGLQKALGMAPALSWIIISAVATLLTIVVALFWVGVPKFKLMQKLVDKLNLVTRENLTGLRVVRAFNNEAREEEKFRIANAELTRVNLFVNRIMTLMQPAMMLILSLSSLAIIWFGAHLINSGDLQIGNMLAFMQYTMNVIMAFMLISMIFIMFPRASVSANRIADVLQVDPTIHDPATPIAINTNGQGRIDFKDVTFNYPGADLPVLTGINFTAMPGETTAFIGSTGSGKSTLINLVPRFYDVSAGQILIDGVDIRQLKLEELYRQIGYVPQKGVLFSGTVKSNITYGNPDISTTEIEKSATIAQATEFINNLEQQYNSEIAQGGSNVSGGQKQRLSIARALAVKPKVYIFDDSFSALDFKTDMLLREALIEETKGKTVLIVGQRISTIANADKIIVLNEGKIVGEGTHEELLKTNKVYREIAYSQLSDEELQSVELHKPEPVGKELQ